ncbi:hypothetical protein HN51_028779, partial [Arachis hypogaea]
VIVRQSVDKAEFQEWSVEKILNLLFKHCESEEEGVHNVVAECLGKIALIEPANLFLHSRTTSPTAFIRATIVIAVNYSIVERPEKIDEIIYPDISSFPMLIKDNDRVSLTPLPPPLSLWFTSSLLDLNIVTFIVLMTMQHVRRAAVLTLSTFAHNKLNLIKGLLLDLLPFLIFSMIRQLLRIQHDITICTCIHLYCDGLFIQELIQTIDLGPVKHIVDDGLELRKAAFGCVDTLLDSCLDQVNPSSFIVPYLKSGLD